MYEVRHVTTKKVYDTQSTFGRAVERADIMAIATHDDYEVVQVKKMYATVETTYKLRPMPEMATVVVESAITKTRGALAGLRVYFGG